MMRCAKTREKGRVSGTSGEDAPAGKSLGMRSVLSHWSDTEPARRLLLTYKCYRPAQIPLVVSSRVLMVG